MIPRQMNWIIFWIESADFFLNWIIFWMESWVKQYWFKYWMNHFLAKFKHWIESDWVSPTTTTITYIIILLQVRGIGTDIAIVSCMVFLAQVKLLHCCIALAFLNLINIVVHPLPVYGFHRGQGRLYCRCGNIFWHKHGQYHNNLYKCHPANLGINEASFIEALPFYS